MKLNDPNTIVWPGHCFDVLYLSPTSMSDVEAYPLPSGDTPTGCKEGNAFALTDANQAQYTTKNVRSKTEYDETHNVITSSWDYSKKTSLSIKLSVGSGKPGKKGAFAASLSTEWTQLNQTSFTLETVNTLTNAVRRSFELNLVNELGNLAGQPVLPIDPDYAAALWAAASGTPQQLSAFFLQYGTHFANQVTMGGIGRQQFTLAVSDYTELSEMNVDVNLAVDATIKAVQVGTEINSSVNVNQAFAEKISGQKTTIEYIGGSSAGPDFNTWLAGVDGDPVPVEVSLLPHDQLICQAYFPTATVAQIAAAAAAMSAAITNYIESNGMDLSQSEIVNNDMILLIPFPPTTDGGGIVPAMFHQPASPVSTQCTVSAPANTTSTEFLANLKTDYARFVWQVSLQGAPSADNSAISMRETRVNLLNMGTSSFLDAEGGVPNRGGVTAMPNTTPLGIVPNSTREWAFDVRSGSKSTSRKLNSGDVIALRRAYPGIAGQPNDPRGFLCPRNNLVYSNGEIAQGGPVANGMAFMVVKVTNEWNNGVAAPAATTKAIMEPAD